MTAIFLSISFQETRKSSRGGITLHVNGSSLMATQPSRLSGWSNTHPYAAAAIVIVVEWLYHLKTLSTSTTANHKKTLVNVLFCYTFTPVFIVIVTTSLKNAVFFAAQVSSVNNYIHRIFQSCSLKSTCLLNIYAIINYLAGLFEAPYKHFLPQVSQSAKLKISSFKNCINGW